MDPVRALLPAASSQRAAGLLAACPLCSLPGTCWVQAWSCHADSEHVVASCHPLISFGSCQMSMAYKERQGWARDVFRGCPAFCGHMACSPQMGNHLSIKRFGLISWNLLLAAHFQSLEQWRSDRLPRQRTAFSERFTAASSLVNWWSRVYLGLGKKKLLSSLLLWWVILPWVKLVELRTRFCGWEKEVHESIKIPIRFLSEEVRALQFWMETPYSLLSPQIREKQQLRSCFLLPLLPFPLSPKCKVLIFCLVEVSVLTVEFLTHTRDPSSLTLCRCFVCCSLLPPLLQKPW